MTIWEILIRDANTQIKLSQARVAKLQKSVRFFIEQQESGVSFPLDSPHLFAPGLPKNEQNAVNTEDFSGGVT